MQSWKTKTLERMDDCHDAICDRCRTGLTYFDGRGEWQGPVRKRTRIRTSSETVADALCLKCACSSGHVHMDGKTKSLSAMQNYEAGFVKLAGDAIHKAMDENWRKREMMKIMVAEEIEESKGKEVSLAKEEDLKLARTHGKQALAVVSKLHRQLGHPGRERLIACLN